MKTIRLANERGIVFVDDGDAATVSVRPWYLHEVKGKRYARTGHALLMHRLILGLRPGDGLEVDHIDGDGLNNQRSNLRVVTHAQNQQNRHRQAGRTSRYRGVTWYASRERWMVRAKVRGVEHFGGYFDDEDAAGRAAVALRQRVMPYAVN